MTETLVFDSFALLAFWQDEPGADQVEQALRRAASDDLRLAMSLVNLGEALYLLERRYGPAQVRQALAFVQAAPLQLYPATLERVLAAAHLKAHYPIAYADAFAAALAQELRAPLLTGDPEFTALEAELSLRWLAR